jgi:hypothetical protein
VCANDISHEGKYASKLSRMVDEIKECTCWWKPNFNKYIHYINNYNDIFLQNKRHKVLHMVSFIFVSVVASNWHTSWLIRLPSDWSGYWGPVWCWLAGKWYAK